MPLSRRDTDFALSRVCTINPRQVPLERALGNLVVYLRTGGRERSSALKAVRLDEFLTHLERQKGHVFHGFAEARPVVQRWLLREGYIELDQDGVVIRGAYPLHLHATKLFRTRYDDFGVAFFVYTALLPFPQVQKDLQEFFSTGSDRPEELSKLDLETLFMARALEDAPHVRPRLEEPQFDPPFCQGQAGLLANDVRRLLLYKEVMPRKVLIQYLTALIGLHIALYYFRLLTAMPSLVTEGTACSVDAQVDGQALRPFTDCPYGVSLFVDASEDYRSGSAELARAAVERLYAAIPPYVKAHLRLKKLAEFGDAWARLGRLAQDVPTDLRSLLALQGHPGLEQWADARILDVLEEDDELEAFHEELKPLLPSAFDRYIELIYPTVYKRQAKHLRQALDAWCGKNTDFGLMRAGRGPRNKRRFHLSTGALELFVHLAVAGYEEAPARGPRRITRRLTVPELLEWMEGRYGILIDKTGTTESAASVEKAIQENLIYFKAKLREIGFFEDLSDASNVQYIKPRFTLG